MNRLFEQRSGSARQTHREPANSRVWAPVVDILEDQNEILLRAELPGMKQEEIQIELTADTLTVSGERRLPSDDRKDAYIRLERAYGRFHRSFTIGVPIKADDVRASYVDGILEIRLPKSEDTKPKKIEVRVGA
jgi:HSP20 family protein